MQWCPLLDVLWGAVLLEDEEVACHPSDRWLHLLHQQDIPVIFAVDLHPRFHEEQFRAPELRDGDGDHECAAESRAGRSAVGDWLQRCVSVLSWIRRDDKL